MKKSGDKKTVTRKEAVRKGLKYYYTGKPCKYGHLARRRVSTSDCLTCCKERGAKKTITSPPARKNTQYATIEQLKDLYTAYKSDLVQVRSELLAAHSNSVSDLLSVMSSVKKQISVMDSKVNDKTVGSVEKTSSKDENQVIEFKKPGRPSKREKMSRMQFCIEPEYESELIDEAISLKIDVSEYVRKLIKGELTRARVDGDKPKAVGRPKMEEHLKRNKQLKIYLTEEEYNILKDVSEDDGRSVSALASSVVLDLIE